MNVHSARRAALTLHVLEASDRDWVLRRLDPRQQSAIEDHLAELHSLGVVADAQLINTALAGAERASSAWRAVLSRQDAGEMHRLLRGEPASLVARVLAHGPWTWEAGLLERMSPAYRARLMQLRNDAGSDGSILDEWLLTDLASRCSPAVDVQALPAAPAKAGTSWTERIKALL